MRNNDLIKSFEYFVSNYNHFSKFEKKNYIFYHLTFLITLILSFPVIPFLAIRLKKKVRRIIIKNKVGVFIRTKNGKKIADSLTKFNEFDIISIGVKGENYFSKLDLVTSVFSSYQIFGNYYYILRNRIMFKNILTVVKVIAFSNLENLIIKNLDFKSVIQFNDHSPESFSLHRNCMIKKIKTVYIQHAPVAKRFPPLYHDLNVLFSLDSLNKYKIANNLAKVKVLFDFRFLEGVSYINTYKNQNKVLLCPNLLDDINKVGKTFEALTKKGYEVQVRMHPADKRRLNNKIDSSNENNIWQDLSETKIVVTNESAVPLEACFVNCLVYKASFWSESIDAYDFIKNGFITREFLDLDSLVFSIMKNENHLNESLMEYYIGKISNSLKLEEVYG